ncbi:hypothetical protein ACNAN0_01610 [Agrilactobacillus fermenti]|uniref:hypothetical protein n=1 Tax=Agrilactobacillus fermenti TaxID=2586909 RepID=UPI003A5BA722
MTLRERLSNYLSSETFVIAFALGITLFFVVPTAFKLQSKIPLPILILSVFVATPIIKWLFTQLGSRFTSEAVLIHIGIGLVIVAFLVCLIFAPNKFGPFCAILGYVVAAHKELIAWITKRYRKK